MSKSLIDLRTLTMSVFALLKWETAHPLVKVLLEFPLSSFNVPALVQPHL